MEFFLQNDNLDALHQLLHTSNELEKVLHPTARKYVQDSTAIARTPVDVKENATSYVFIADMPGLTSSDIQVQVENEKTLSISGKRKREEKPEDEDGKYIRMERRPAKFMRKFTLPGDANTDKISASCKDGILTVTVQKVAPEPEKPKVIEIPVS